MAPKPQNPLIRKIVANNRRAQYDYFLEDRMEVGMILTGTEVKSLRAGHANLNDAFAGEMGGEIYLFNAYIAEYPQARHFNHETRRPRKLLMHKKQINKLIGKLKTKGVTLAAISIYFNEKNRAKLEIAVATGKKQHDKREAIKEREWNREKARVLKGDRE